MTRKLSAFGWFRAIGLFLLVGLLYLLPALLFLVGLLFLGVFKLIELLIERWHTVYQNLIPIARYVCPHPWTEFRFRRYGYVRHFERVEICQLPFCNHQLHSQFSCSVCGSLVQSTLEQRTAFEEGTFVCPACSESGMTRERFIAARDGMAQACSHQHVGTDAEIEPDFDLAANARWGEVSNFSGDDDSNCVSNCGICHDCGTIIDADVRCLGCYGLLSAVEKTLLQSEDWRPLCTACRQLPAFSDDELESDPTDPPAVSASDMSSES